MQGDGLEDWGALNLWNTTAGWVAEAHATDDDTADQASCAEVAGMAHTSGVSVVVASNSIVASGSSGWTSCGNPCYPSLQLWSTSSSGLHHFHTENANCSHVSDLAATCESLAVFWKGDYPNFYLPTAWIGVYHLHDTQPLQLRARLDLCQMAAEVSTGEDFWEDGCFEWSGSLALSGNVLAFGINVELEEDPEGLPSWRELKVVNLCELESARVSSTSQFKPVVGPDGIVDGSGDVFMAGDHIAVVSGDHVKVYTTQI